MNLRGLDNDFIIEDISIHSASMLPFNDHFDAAEDSIGKMISSRWMRELIENRKNKNQITNEVWNLFFLTYGRVEWVPTGWFLFNIQFCSAKYIRPKIHIIISITVFTKDFKISH